MEMISNLIDFFGFLAIVSFVAIVIHFFSDNKWTENMMDLFLGPLLVLKYRKYTKKKYGKTGLLYYLFMLSFAALIILLIFECVKSVTM